MVLLWELGVQRPATAGQQVTVVAQISATSTKQQLLLRMLRLPRNIVRVAGAQQCPHPNFVPLQGVCRPIAQGPQ